MGASLMGVLVGLLILRFAVMLLVDMCCGEDFVCRKMVESFRNCCPWWHRRTQPAPSALSSSSGISPTDSPHPSTPGMVADATSTIPTVTAETSSSTIELSQTAARGTVSEFNVRHTIFLQQLLPGWTLRKRDVTGLQTLGNSYRMVTISIGDEEAGNDSSSSCYSSSQSISNTVKPQLKQLDDKQLLSESILNGETNARASPDLEAPMYETSLRSCDQAQIKSTNSNNTVCLGGHGKALCCSICLHDLFVGQEVCQVGACGHCFHAPCLRQWLVRQDTSLNNGKSDFNVVGNNHCPNCRAPIVLESDLDEILGILRWQQLSMRAIASSASSLNV